MGDLLNNKRVLISKIETVYGTDSVPVGTDAILISEAKLTPLVADTEKRGNLRPYLGRDKEIHVGENVQLTFSCEVAGAGSAALLAGTAPAFGKLLRACGFSETITIAQDAVYSPVSASFESITHVFNLDGQNHKMTGCRGTVSIVQDVNKLPKFQFAFTGIYNAPSSVAAVTPDFSAFQTPEPAGKGRTGQFSLGGWAGVPISLTTDIANSVVFHQTLTTNEIKITDREPAGQLRVEATDLSTKNFFTEALANGTGALSIQHGQTSGNIVVIDAPNTQILKPDYGDLNGMATVDMGLAFIPGNSGDDELTITVK